jgi:riboflavin biosynthesis pyrimidine reductase
MTVCDQADHLEDLVEFYRDPPRGVRANMIFSADGAAAFGGRAGPLSCPLDQQLLRALRGFADVVLVGAGTARAENYGPVRLAGATGAVPPIAVVTATGNLPARMFDTSAPPPILLTSEAAAARNDLHSDRHRQVLTAGAQTIDFAAAIDQLKSEGMQHILCEGGPTLLDSLVEADLVEEICVTIAPKLAGGQPVGTRVQAHLSAPASLRLRHVVQHGDYLFLRYSR